MTVSIGSLGKWNSSVQIHDVVVDGAFVSNTENGVRIKTWQVIFLAVYSVPKTLSKLVDLSLIDLLPPSHSAFISSLGR